MDQYVVLCQGGGTVDEPDTFRAIGPFPSEEEARAWMDKEFGGLSEVSLEYYQPHVTRIEDPSEY
jgi:hypothetical protein